VEARTKPLRFEPNFWQSASSWASAIPFFANMRRTWPIPLGVALVGALAGVAIAGQSDPITTFVIDAASETSTTISPIVTLSPTTAVSDTVDIVVTAPPDSVDIPTTTAAPSATVAPTTTTVAATTTTAVTTTTAPADQTLDPSQVRLVLANGDGRFNLVGRNAERLNAAGYTQIDQEDAAHVPATVLYYRPGFEDEAAWVAAALTIPDALLQPLTDVPITPNDALGDIIVVLGPDAPR
jgi:hypothetical protein